MQQTTPAPVTRFERALQYCLLMALLTVPFSTWLTNLFALLALAGALAGLAASPSARRALRAPPALLALALLGALLVASAWSIAPRAEVLLALKKYLKLVMLPLALVLALRDHSLPQRALKFYAAGSAVLAASCFLVWLDLMPQSKLGWWRVGDQADAFAFKNHITIGILLGFSALASFLYASYAATLRARLAWLAAGLFAAVPVVFLNQGRAGYLVILAGLLTLFLLRVRLTLLNGLAAGAAIGALALALYTTSDNFQARSAALWTELHAEQQQTPTGQRISFMKSGMAMVAASPVFGNGTGSFAEGYAPDARRLWGAGTQFGETRHQPHSEFMGNAVQLGVAGLVLYFALLGALLRPALRVRAIETDMLVLLWTIYTFCSAFNSLLWDPTEAYWFLMLSGCLYAAALRKAQALP